MLISKGLNKNLRWITRMNDMDYSKIINHFYPEDNELRRLLLVHSRAVADKALHICDRHPEMNLNRDFVEAAAMLHDIGIMKCDAPGIFCHGTEPYIRHGIMGAEMLRLLEPSGALEPFARVCQRHTGAGITRREVLEQGLPMPLPDDDSEPYMPETIEEQIVCYADKFFSKTKLDREKTMEEVVRSLAKFGTGGVARFQQWAQTFE